MGTKNLKYQKRIHQPFAKITKSAQTERWAVQRNRRSVPGFHLICTLLSSSFLAYPILRIPSPISTAVHQSVRFHKPSPFSMDACKSLLPLCDSTTMSMLMLRVYYGIHPATPNQSNKLQFLIFALQIW